MGEQEGGRCISISSSPYIFSLVMAFLTSYLFIYFMYPWLFSYFFQNPVELEGLKQAHIRDGAAVVQYLVWLDNQV